MSNMVIIGAGLAGMFTSFIRGAHACKPGADDDKVLHVLLLARNAPTPVSC